MTKQPDLSGVYCDNHIWSEVFAGLSLHGFGHWSPSKGELCDQRFEEFSLLQLGLESFVIVVLGKHVVVNDGGVHFLD